ncbi:MAG: OmpA family protein [Verrucomicrobiales bacterium]|nr:OmpA family protein [Verrucomicrobiales bacterium]
MKVFNQPSHSVSRFVATPTLPAVTAAAAILFGTSLTYAGSCSSGTPAPPRPVCKPSPPKPVCKPSRPKPVCKPSRPKPKRNTYRKPCLPPQEKCYCPAPPRHHCTDSYLKDGFVRRLDTAPSNMTVNYHTPINPNLPALRNYSYASPQVRMIGKVGYSSGQSSLSWEAKQHIEQSLLSVRPQFGPNATVVVMGFADKAGPYDTNLGISSVRADNVRKHINELNWKHGLQIQTDIVAMGEEIELCSNEFSHHRAAEIWVVDSPVAPATIAPTHMSQTQPYQAQPYQAQPHQVQPQQVQTYPTQSFQAQPQQVPASSVPTSFTRQANPYYTGQTAQMPSGLPGAYQPQTAPATPVNQQPQVAANPLEGLIQFLEKNVVLAPDADPNEFARHLSQVRQSGIAQ